MKKRINKILMIFLSFVIGVGSVSASSVSISTPSSVTKGNTAKVTVTVNADSGIYTIIGSVSCSGAGASGGIDLSFDDMNTSSSSKSYSFNVKPTSSGTVTCSSSGVRIRELAKDSEYALNNASATIKVVEPAKVTPKEYSSDNYLKELGVEGYELSPKFDKDTLEYSLKVDESVEKIKINASANDSKASVSGAGEVAITAGENKIEVKVTAENGNEKVYKLNITVEDQKPIKVAIDKTNYTIVKKNHDETIKPENFEETTIKIDDQDVIAYVNKKSNLTLVVLKNNQGKTGLYVYDAKKKSYTPYKVLKVGSLTLYIQNMDKNDIPKGYSKYSFKVNDVSYTSYRLSQSSKFDLIYGMNVENGEKSLYIYDEKEGTLQRYDEDMLKDLTSKYKSEQKYLYIAVSGLIALSLVLIVVLIVSNKKKKRKNKVKI